MGERIGDQAESYGRAFWSEANRNFAMPHYRLQKAVRIVTKIAQDRDCALLDLGCGPATLSRVLPANIHYYGMDIAIHQPAPNLIETDLREAPIKFGDKRFDIVLAQGVFEYLGDAQSRKFAEIAEVLESNGKFVVSYWNFGHRKTEVYHAFSNVQSFDEFRTDLSRYFRIERSFPASHNWRHTGPNRRVTRAINMYFNMHVPIISPLLAVEYFLICSPRCSS